VNRGDVLRRSTAGLAAATIPELAAGRAALAQSPAPPAFQLTDVNRPAWRRFQVCVEGKGLELT
jgi:hypothetical protein